MCGSGEGVVCREFEGGGRVGKECDDGRDVGCALGAAGDVGCDTGGWAGGEVGLGEGEDGWEVGLSALGKVGEAAACEGEGGRFGGSEELDCAIGGLERGAAEVGVGKPFFKGCVGYDGGAGGEEGTHVGGYDGDVGHGCSSCS